MSAAITDFEGLYAKHAPDVFRFALYLSADRGAAEDITAETFARAWAARASIDAATVKGYLFTIARNLFLHGRRGAGRLVPLDPEMPSRDAGPHDHALARDELRAALAELQRLPELDRAAILMRAVHDMPYEEIARALGLSLVAPIAATLIQLGVSRSREYLADETGARLSGDPEALATALEKLERTATLVPAEASPATASLFIVSPLAGGGLMGLFSTHPPTKERARRLRALAGLPVVRLAA